MRNLCCADSNSIPDNVRAPSRWAIATSLTVSHLCRPSLSPLTVSPLTVSPLSPKGPRMHLGCSRYMRRNPTRPNPDQPRSSTA